MSKLFDAERAFKREFQRADQKPAERLTLVQTWEGVVGPGQVGQWLLEIRVDYWLSHIVHDHSGQPMYPQTAWEGARQAHDRWTVQTTAMLPDPALSARWQQVLATIDLDGKVFFNDRQKALLLERMDALL